MKRARSPTPVSGCQLCLSDAPLLQLQPCGHYNFCRGCVREIAARGSICPMCRDTIRACRPQPDVCEFPAPLPLELRLVLTTVPALMAYPLLADFSAQTDAVNVLHAAVATGTLVPKHAEIVRWLERVAVLYPDLGPTSVQCVLKLHTGLPYPEVNGAVVEMVKILGSVWLRDPETGPGLLQAWVQLATLVDVDLRHSADLGKAFPVALVQPGVDADTACAMIKLLCKMANSDTWLLKSPENAALLEQACERFQGHSGFAEEVFWFMLCVGDKYPRVAAPIVGSLMLRHAGDTHLAKTFLENVFDMASICRGFDNYQSTFPGIAAMVRLHPSDTALVTLALRVCKRVLRYSRSCAKTHAKTLLRILECVASATARADADENQHNAALRVVRCAELLCAKSDLEAWGREPLYRVVAPFSHGLAPKSAKSFASVAATAVTGSSALMAQVISDVTRLLAEATTEQVATACVDVFRVAARGKDAHGVLTAALPVALDSARRFPDCAPLAGYVFGLVHQLSKVAMVPCPVSDIACALERFMAFHDTAQACLRCLQQRVDTFEAKCEAGLEGVVCRTLAVYAGEVDMEGLCLEVLAGGLVLQPDWKDLFKTAKRHLEVNADHEVLVCGAVGVLNRVLLQPYGRFDFSSVVPVVRAAVEGHLHNKEVANRFVRCWKLLTDMGATKPKDVVGEVWMVLGGFPKEVQIGETLAALCVAGVGSRGLLTYLPALTAVPKRTIQALQLATDYLCIVQRAAPRLENSKVVQSEVRKIAKAFKDNGAVQRLCEQATLALAVVE